MDFTRMSPYKKVEDERDTRMNGCNQVQFNFYL